MRTLGIDLQEGFSGETVMIELDGHEIFRQEKVQTKLLLGFAETTTYQVPEGDHELMIRVGSKGIEEKIKVETEGDIFLGISLVGEKIEVIYANKPFYYQ
jgi:hypothetical protein